jgi:hypothetical protein
VSTTGAIACFASMPAGDNLYLDGFNFTVELSSGRTLRGRAESGLRFVCLGWAVEAASASSAPSADKSDSKRPGLIEQTESAEAFQVLCSEPFTPGRRWKRCSSGSRY